VGLRPEKTKPIAFTFPAKSRYEFRREREKMGRRCVVFLSREPRTTSATFLGSIYAKLSTNTCPSAGSRRMVSHFRKVSTKGSNFPKNRLFRVQKGTLFVPSLRVTGNVLRCLHCFHPLVDIPQIYPSSVTFAEGCTHFAYISFKHTRQGARIANLYWSLTPVHIF